MGKGTWGTHKRPGGSEARWNREIQQSKGAALGNRIVSLGYMTAASIPVSGFPLSGGTVSGGGWQPRVAGGGWECRQAGEVRMERSDFADGCFPGLPE